MPAASSWEDRVAFEACCSFWEKVATESNKQRKVAKLTSFLGDCRRLQSEAEAPSSSSLFPIVRLLLPQLDRDRPVYGIKETVLAKLYIDMLKLGPTSADAIKLKNYRAPKSKSGDAGDFAAVLFTVVQTRQYGDAKAMKLGDVNRRLDEIADVNAREGRATGAVERLLMGMFKAMTALQQKWLVRIILKDMKLGLGPASVLKQFHPDASDLFDVTSNLLKVCQQLNDPAARLNEIEIRLFEPFKPMLADRAAVRDAVKQMGEKEFFIEVKYDGE